MVCEIWFVVVRVNEALVNVPGLVRVSSIRVFLVELIEQQFFHVMSFIIIAPYKKRLWNQESYMLICYFINY